MVLLMDEERREILDALSDKTRLAILEAASNRPMSGDEISEAVQRSRSTVESHLSMLLRLGLLERTKDDKRYYYRSTEKAKAWMGSAMGPPQPSTPALERGAINPLVIVLVAGTVGGVYYSLVNTFLAPFPIWLFAAIMGIACAWVCKGMKRLLQIFLVTSLVVALLSAAIGLGELAAVNVLILFALCLAFLVALGLPLWYVTRRLRVAWSKRGK